MCRFLAKTALFILLAIIPIHLQADVSLDQLLNSYKRLLEGQVFSRANIPQDQLAEREKKISEKVVLSPDENVIKKLSSIDVHAIFDFFKWKKDLQDRQLDLTALDTKGFRSVSSRFEVLIRDLLLPLDGTHIKPLIDYSFARMKEENEEDDIGASYGGRAQYVEPIAQNLERGVGPVLSLTQFEAINHADDEICSPEQRTLRYYRYLADELLKQNYINKKQHRRLLKSWLAEYMEPAIGDKDLEAKLKMLDEIEKKIKESLLRPSPMPQQSHKTTDEAKQAVPPAVSLARLQELEPKGKELVDIEDLRFRAFLGRCQVLRQYLSELKDDKAKKTYARVNNLCRQIGDSPLILQLAKLRDEAGSVAGNAKFEEWQKSSRPEFTKWRNELDIAEKSELKRIENFEKRTYKPMRELRQSLQNLFLKFQHIKRFLEESPSSASKEWLKIINELETKISADEATVKDLQDPIRYLDKPYFPPAQLTQFLERINERLEQYQNLYRFYDEQVGVR